MRAVVVERFGGPQELTLREVPVSAPETGKLMLGVPG